MSQEMVVREYNSSTGEVYKDEIPLQEGDAYIPGKRYTKKQKEYVETHCLDFNNIMPYGKLYFEMMPYINKEITDGDWTFFCNVCRFMGYGDCILRPFGDRRYKPFTNIAEIADALDESYESVRRRINTLYVHQLIIKIDMHGTMNYMVNPYVIFRGKDLELTFVSGLENNRWAKYNDEITNKLRGYVERPDLEAATNY